MSNDYIKVQRRPLMDLLTCPLCPNLYREATTICVCLHAFCKQCIYQKLEKDKRNHCPVCNAYLGSYPEELLRNDHNLQELVMRIFPPEKTSEEERAAASPVEVKIAETAAPTLAEVNTQHQEFSISRAAELIRDEQDVAGNNLHLNLTDNKISDYSIIAIEKQVINAQVKRRRSTRRKPCKFLSGQREDYLNIVTGKETSKAGPSGLGNGRSIDSGNLYGETISLKELPSYSPHSVWFCLLACQEMKHMALPQIPKPFITTKNGDLAVSLVNKYLAKKLNLKHKSEVEVMCFGHPLDPNLTLNDLIDIWLETVSGMGPESINHYAEGADGGNFVMKLTYRRSNHQSALQSNLDSVEPSISPNKCFLGANEFFK